MRTPYYLAAALILSTVWLQACATAVEPVCRHKAVYQAISFHDLTGHPVRIAVGPSDIGTHAQAQAQVDGKWEWLEQGEFGVGTGYKDTVPGFEPNRYESLEEFLRYFGYYASREVHVAERQDNGVPSTAGDYSSSRSLYRSPW